MDNDGKTPFHLGECLGKGELTKTFLVALVHGKTDKATGLLDPLLRLN